ncbi:MAG: hypothetical protein ACI4PR_03255 [Acutalibacteraceae bacterium]
MGLGSVIKGGLSSAASSMLSGNFGSEGSTGLNPSFEMKLNGKEIKLNEGSLLTDVCVDRTIFDSKAGICMFTIKNTRMEFNKSKISINDDLVFQLGSKIELSMGYGGKNLKIFTGYVVKSVSSVEHLTNSCVISVSKVVCMDPKWFLMSKREFNCYSLSKKYSAVVSSILNDMGYAQKFSGVTIDISGEPNPNDFLGNYVACQEGESDFEFLKMLAEETGCLFYADEEGCLNFISIDSNKKPKGIKKSIESDKGIIEVSVEGNRGDIPLRVCVLGINKDDIGGVIKGESKDSVPIGSGKDSDTSTKNVPRSSVFEVNTGSVISKKLAEFRAQAIMNLKEIKFMQVSVKFRGNPGFKLGQMVKVSKTAMIPDSEYMVSGIKNEYNSQPGAEYTTTVTLNATRSNPVPTIK